MPDKKFSLFILLIFLALVLVHHSPFLTQVYHQGKDLVFCPFKRVTGLPCPGCGMTRAFWEMAGGNLKKALAFNPFSVVLLGLALADLALGERARRLEGVYRWLLPGLLIWWLIRVT